MGQQVALHLAKLAVGGKIVSEASPSNYNNIKCLYIAPWVGDYLIPQVVVAAGVMLDLISLQLVPKLKIKDFRLLGLV